MNKTVLLSAFLAGVLGLHITAAERFDPVDMGEAVTLRTAFAVRTSIPPTLDGILSESAWQNTGLLSDFRALASNAGNTEPLYLRHFEKNGKVFLARNPTFVRLSYDAKRLYIAIVALNAPAGPSDSVIRADSDQVLLRLDPFTRGRHALEFVFNRKGLVRVYDSHETWAYGFAPALKLVVRALDDKDRDRLPPEERAALAACNGKAHGWIAEMALSWADLAASAQPGAGEVWALVVAKG